MAVDHFVPMPAWMAFRHRSRRARQSNGMVIGLRGSSQWQQRATHRAPRAAAASAAAAPVAAAAADEPAGAAEEGAPDGATAAEPGELPPEFALALSRQLQRRPSVEEDISMAPVGGKATFTTACRRFGGWWRGRGTAARTRDGGVRPTRPRRPSGSRCCSILSSMLLSCCFNIIDKFLIVILEPLNLYNVRAILWPFMKAIFELFQCIHTKSEHFLISGFAKSF